MTFVPADWFAGTSGAFAEVAMVAARNIAAIRGRKGRVHLVLILNNSLGVNLRFSFRAQSSSQRFIMQDWTLSEAVILRALKYSKARALRQRKLMSVAIWRTQTNPAC